MKPLLTLIIGATLIGCSAEHHLRKFKKKGGEISPRIELVEYTDTIKVNGKDSIILVKVPVTCPELKVPETRWRTKIEYKYRYKVLKQENDVIKTEIKYRYRERKQAVKESNKRVSNWYWWLISGYVLNFVVRKSYFYLLSKSSLK